MQEGQITSKSWFYANRKWVLPAGVILSFLILLSLFSLPVSGVLGFGTALSDTALYAGAVKIANADKEAVRLYGTISDIDKLAILESDVNYSNDRQYVKLTVRISGSKLKGKMDVEAERNGESWKYSSLQLRSKNPDITISVIKR